MPAFLFWNIAGSSIEDLIVILASSYAPDILVLAECTLDPNRLLVALSAVSPDYQWATSPSNACDKLLFFTKFDSNYLVPMDESSRVSIRRLQLPARREIVVAGAHLPSKLFFGSDSQFLECVNLARRIEAVEEAAGHRRTILLGDLNVNPFEPGVMAAGGLHAVTTREIATRGSRIVQDKQYNFFYNPMWKYFGDRHDGPPGTYYLEKAEEMNYFWNTFDQVLVRPEVLSGLTQDGVQVLTKAGTISLVDNRGRPDRKHASDHLPILVNLDF